MLSYLYLIFIAVMGCVWQLVIKENDDDDDYDHLYPKIKFPEDYH